MPEKLSNKKPQTVCLTSRYIILQFMCGSLQNRNNILSTVTVWGYLMWIWEHFLDHTCIISLR